MPSQWQINNSGLEYGGEQNDNLLNQEQNMWRQNAQNGVQVSTQNQQGQQNNLLGSTANQQQSQQAGYDAMGLMRAQAMGGDTPAMQQARAAAAYANNAQRAMAANAGGPQALAAARTAAANNGALQQSNNANQMNALAAQEQQTGMSLYGDMSNQMRGNAQQMYGDQNNYNYATAQQQMQVNQANDQLMLGYGAMQNTLDQAQMNNLVGNSQFNMQQQQIQAQNGINTANGAMNGLMSGGGAIGSYLSANSNGGGGSDYPGGEQQFNSDVGDNPGDGNYWSDDRLKGDVSRTGLMRPFLDTLAHSRATYRYRNPLDEPRAIPTGGRYAGVMAQDLERVPDIGHQLVIDTPHGKMVDTKTSLSALMAGVGDIHDRVKRLEGYREYDND